MCKYQWNSQQRQGEEDICTFSVFSDQLGCRVRFPFKNQVRVHQGIQWGTLWLSRWCLCKLLVCLEIEVLYWPEAIKPLFGWTGHICRGLSGRICNNDIVLSWKFPQAVYGSWYAGDLKLNESVIHHWIDWWDESATSVGVSTLNVLKQEGKKVPHDLLSWPSGSLCWCKPFSAGYLWLTVQLYVHKIVVLE